MLPFENQVADYVRETGNHVLYRATPVFSGEELVARGVELEAWSVEDGGEGVCFHVWCYNAQPGVSIDYATGESVLAAQLEEEKRTGYVLNIAKKKFHLPDCQSVKQMAPENRKNTRSTREALIQKGWEPCGRCKP
jgi:DNA-entry nuclease